MDAILAEVYSTVLPAAPYVIGAYVGIWIVSLYTLMLSRRSKRPRATSTPSSRRSPIARRSSSANVF